MEIIIFSKSFKKYFFCRRVRNLSRLGRCGGEQAQVRPCFHAPARKKKYFLKLFEKIIISIESLWCRSWLRADMRRASQAIVGALHSGGQAHSKGLIRGSSSKVDNFQNAWVVRLACPGACTALTLHHGRACSAYGRCHAPLEDATRAGSCTFRPAVHRLPAGPMRLHRRRPRDHALWLSPLHAHARLRGV